MENFELNSEQNKLKRHLELCAHCISTVLPIFSPQNISEWSATLTKLQTQSIGI